MFDPSLEQFDRKADPTLAPSIDAPESRELARTAAEEGSVLLLNDGSLPLDPARVRSIAVVGPFGDGEAAERAMLGGYSPGQPAKGTVTVAEGLRRRGFDVSVAVGCGAGVGGPSVTPADFDAAVALASKADAVVVALGTTSCGCCVRCGNGEAGDRMSLEPEGKQLALLGAVVKAAKPRNTPVIVVLVHGRPMSFQGDGGNGGNGGGDAGNGGGNGGYGGGGGGSGAVGANALAGVNAMLSTWRPGEEGGSAIANLLLGDTNPSGRLAQAWQRSAGYIHSPTSPWFQAHSSMVPGKYFGNGDGTPLTPLFPFGHGLSYTTFQYDGLAASTASLPATWHSGLRFQLHLTVRNNGTRAGSTVVLAAYTRQTRGVVRHMKELCAFAKVHLNAGEERTVAMDVRVSDLARYDPYAARDAPPVEMSTGGGGAHGGLSEYSYPGAWLIDGGAYTFFAAGCISNPALRDAHHHGDPDCPYATAIDGVTVSIGREGEVFGRFV